MPDRELNITLRFIKERAERQAQQFHENERRRQRETGDSQEKIDRERDHNLRQRAQQWARIDANASRQRQRRFADEQARIVADFEKAEKAKRDAARKTYRENAASLKAMVDATAASWRSFDAQARRHALEVKRIFQREFGKGVEIPIKLGSWARQLDSRKILRALREDAREFAKELHRDTLAIVAMNDALRDGKAASAGVRAEMEKAAAARKAFARQAAEDAEEEAEREKDAAGERVRLFGRVADEKAALARRYADRAEKLHAEADRKEAAGRKLAARNYRQMAEDMLATARRLAGESAESLGRARAAAKSALRGMGDETKQAVKVALDGVGEAAKGVSRRIEEVGDASTRSNRVQRTETNATRNAIREQQRDIMKVSTAYTAMRVAALANRGIHLIFAAMKESALEADRYIEGLVDHMRQMREEAAEILAMRGESVTAGATAAMAGRAEANMVAVRDQMAFEGEIQRQMHEVIGAGDDTGALTPEDIRGGKRITNAQIEALQVPAYAAAMGGGKELQGAAGKVLNAVVRGLPRDAGGRLDQGRLEADFADVMESVQSSVGGNAEAAENFGRFMDEYVGEGRVFADTRKAAAMFRILSRIGPGKAYTLARALVKGQFQLKQDDEKLAELGLTGKESAEDFLFKSFASIRKIADREGEDFNKVLARYYNEIREFEGAGLLDFGVTRGDFDAVLRSMQGGVAAKRRRIAEFRASARARGFAAASGKERAKLEAGGRHEELGILTDEVERDLISGGKMEQAQEEIEALATEAGRTLTGVDRRQRAIYQERGRRIRERLESFRDSEEAQGFLAGPGNRLELDATHWFINTEAQSRGLRMARRLEAGRDARVARGLTPAAPSPLAFRNAAMRRAHNELVAEGAIPASASFGEAIDTHGHLIRARANRILSGLLPAAAIPPRGRSSEVVANPLTGHNSVVSSPEGDAEYGLRLGRALARLPDQDRTLEAVMGGPGNRAANDAFLRKQDAGALKSIPPLAPGMGHGFLSIPPTAVAAAMAGARRVVLPGADGRRRRAIPQDLHGIVGNTAVIPDADVGRHAAFGAHAGALIAREDAAREGRAAHRDITIAHFDIAESFRRVERARAFASHQESVRRRRAELKANTDALSAPRKAKEEAARVAAKRAAIDREVRRADDVSRVGATLERNRRIRAEAHRGYKLKTEADYDFWAPGPGPVGWGRGPIAQAMAPSIDAMALSSARHSHEAATREWRDAQDRLTGAIRGGAGGAEIGRLRGAYGNSEANLERATANLERATANSERAQRQLVPTPTPGRPPVQAR